MNIRRHTIYNLLGAALPILVSLATVPAYLHTVGEARFGILAIVWLFLGYFGLFDLGLGMATAQRMAAREADGPAVQSKIFWTALFSNLTFGTVGGIVAWPVATYYFGSVLNVGTSLRDEMLAAVPYLTLAVPLATVTGVATGALQGLNKFGALNIISVIGALLFQIVPLAIAVWWSPALTIVLPATLATQLITLCLLLATCHRSFLRGQSVAFERSELGTLFRFGFWVSISAFFSPLVTMIDRFIIGATISASAVSVYAVPFNLGQRLCILGNSAGSALFPKFAALNRKEAKRLARDSESALAAVMLLFTSTGILLVGAFLTVWVGSDFAGRATPAAQIILVGVWFEGVSRVPLYALRGWSRPEAIARIDALQVVPFGIALYLLISNFGLEGVASAYVLRSAMNYLLLSRAAGTLRAVRAVVPVAAAVLSVSLLLGRSTEPLTSTWFIAIFLVAGTASVSAWFISPESARENVRSLKCRLRGVGHRR